MTDGSADGDEDRAVALDIDYGTAVVFDTDGVNALFLSGVPSDVAGNPEAGGVPGDEAILDALEEEGYDDAEFEYGFFQGVAPKYDPESFDAHTPDDYDETDPLLDEDNYPLVETDLLDELDVNHVVGPDTTWFDLPPTEEDGLSEAVGDDVSVARVGAGESLSPPDSDFRVNVLHPSQDAAEDSVAARDWAPDVYEPRFAGMVVEVECGLGNVFLGGPAHLGAVSDAFAVRAAWDRFDSDADYHRDIDAMFLSGMAMEGVVQEKNQILRGTEPTALHVSDEMFAVSDVAAELTRRTADSKDPSDYLGGLTADGDLESYDEVNLQSLVEQVRFGDGIELTAETFRDNGPEDELLDHLERMDDPTDDAEEAEGSNDPADVDDEGTDEGQSAA